MKEKGWKTLKNNKKKGVSMVIVLCISAFFIAFGAAIIYTAGLLTSSSNQRLEEERAYQLSKSYGEVVRQEILKYDQKDLTNINDTIYAFANSFLDNPAYANYNDSRETKYRFILKNTDLKNISQTNEPLTSYGNIMITLYKDQNDNEKKGLSSGTLIVKNDNYTAEIESLKNTGVRQYNLYVDVTAYLKDISYTTHYEFTREEKYALQFKHDGTNIVWDENNGCWRIGSTSGSVYNFIDQSKPIEYTYLNQANTSQFIEAKDQGGNE